MTIFCFMCPISYLHQWELRISMRNRTSDLSRGVYKLSCLLFTNNKRFGSPWLLAVQSVRVKVPCSRGLALRATRWQMPSSHLVTVRLKAGQGEETKIRLSNTFQEILSRLLISHYLPLCHISRLTYKAPLGAGFWLSRLL